MSGRRYFLRVESSDGTVEVEASRSDLVEIGRLIAQFDPAGSWPPPTGDMHESRLWGIHASFGDVLPDEDEITGRGGYNEYIHAAKRYWDHQEEKR